MNKKRAKTYNKFLKKCYLFLLFSLIIFSNNNVHAAGNLSAEKSEAISRNCPTIKTQLQQLRRVDSRTRTYLGTNYEMILNRFITPLNLRLVRNNRDTLANVQADYIATQTDFKQKYTEYMRELEGLLNIDCQVDQDNFYSQLQNVRMKREDLRESTDTLLTLAHRQYQAAGNLKESL